MSSKGAVNREKYFSLYGMTGSMEVQRVQRACARITLQGEAADDLSAIFLGTVRCGVNEVTFSPRFIKCLRKNDFQKCEVKFQCYF